MRLDIYLTTCFEVQSRNKASELIKEKKVLVDGKIVTKPSFEVNEKNNIKIDQDQFFVSRAAYKLKYFLDEFPIDMNNLDVLDIGSSTGGFTQIVLQSPVKSVTCVDVGSNQLHEIVREDKRVVVQENTDIRQFEPKRTYDLVTCDVSFISILNILKDIDRLSKEKIILLYKPQFEVGKDVKRDRSGVVLDKEAITKVRKEFLNLVQEELSWNLIHHQESKITGKSGNVEELFYFNK